METTLENMSIGRSGMVLGFVRGNTPYRQKLLAMGLIKGTEFEVVRVAPMGDPVEIRVRGYSLSLRKDEAKSLRVKEV